MRDMKHRPTFDAVLAANLSRRAVLAGAAAVDPGLAPAPLRNVALLAGLRQTATAADYTMFSSLPVVLLGFTPPDDNAHAPNESMEIDNYERGIRCIARYWDALATALTADGTSPGGTR